MQILHTADWHLGRKYAQFGDRDVERRLQQARTQAVQKVFHKALTSQAAAVLCAGDLFDVPQPGPDWVDALLAVLAGTDPGLLVVLLPGNHDPLEEGSVWDEDGRLARGLPPNVRVVRRPGETFELGGGGAVVVAVPCRSRQSGRDPLEGIPPPAPGDPRLRIGLVHGSLAAPGKPAGTAHPISLDRAAGLGLDYLALGDWHEFRELELPGGGVAVYPGTPEPLAFDLADAGHAALVQLYRKGRRPRVVKEDTGEHVWREATCKSLGDLERLAAEDGLKRTVLRLVLEFETGLAGRLRASELVGQLRGSDPWPARVAVLQCEDQVKVVPAAGEFPAGLPEAVGQVVARLEARLAEAERDLDPEEPESVVRREAAARALEHLLQLVRAERDGGGRC